MKLELSKPSVEVVAEEAMNPALSPDGRTLAYVARPLAWSEAGGHRDWWSTDPGELVMRDLENGSQRRVPLT